MANQPSVFQMNPLTGTGTPVPKAGGDNHAPTDGSVASWSAITSESFLPGPQPGKDQTFIKTGDQTAKVAEGQNLTEVKKISDTHVTDGKTILKFDKSRETTIKDNDTLTIISGNFSISVDGGKQTVNVKQSSSLEAQKVEITGREEIILKVGGNFIKIDMTGITVFGTLVKIN